MVPGRPYRPQLEEGPITRQAWARTPLGQVARDDDGAPLLFDLGASASAASRWEMRDVLPAIWLNDRTRADRWRPQRDLLSSDRFAAEFVVEVEDDGRASLRFGDGILGAQPAAKMEATYRVGNGQAGNVGAEAIAHVVTPLSGIRCVRNPLPAKGGAGPEPIDQVRLYAPQAFRTQERAVTEADYAVVTQRHPEVQKAAATRRWTGSWYTMSVTVDRRRGAPVDADFTADLLGFLDRFRLAGYDLEVEAPLFVPLDIVLTVCVAPGHFRSAVKPALLEAFCNHDLPDGGRGFFHPDNFTFGRPVYLSQVIVAAMQVPGVLWVDVDDTPPKPNRFRRWGEESRGERAEGRIHLGRLEIARLDNDPNRPENGKIDFVMQGGL
jgi:predicted phage baseplate assembly protein